MRAQTSGDASELGRCADTLQWIRLHVFPGTRKSDFYLANAACLLMPLLLVKAERDDPFRRAKLCISKRYHRRGAGSLMRSNSAVFAEACQTRTVRPETDAEYLARLRGIARDRGLLSDDAGRRGRSDDPALH